jgi:endo-1,4-beta-D-glucanase Y
VTNLSYFVPYAHPWFQAADPAGSWDGVTEVGYDVLERWLQEPGYVLPPAFVRMERDGRLSALAPEAGLQSDFSFDAVRIFWRVEADCRLTGNDRACSDPLGVARAAEALVVDGKIVSHYGLDGVPKTDEESLSFYAALLPSLRRHAPEVVEPVLTPRLRGAPLDELVAAEDRYWDRNWVWFGLALDAGIIEERTPGLPR